MSDRILTDAQRWAVVIACILAALLMLAWATYGIYRANDNYAQQLNACLAKGGNLISTSGSGFLCLTAVSA